MTLEAQLSQYAFFSQSSSQQQQQQQQQTTQGLTRLVQLPSPLNTSSIQTQNSMDMNSVSLPNQTLPSSNFSLSYTMSVGQYSTQTHLVFLHYGTQ